MTKDFNAGEINEFLLKIYLVYLRDYQADLNTPFGTISSVGLYDEYKNLGLEINFDELMQACSDGNFTSLIEITEQLGIEKASPNCKADVFINNEGVSTKFLGGSSPALVNHTSREKWLRIAGEINFDMSTLDILIERYWDNVQNNIHPIDINNANPKSPFYNALEDLRPILNYYSFKGTGRGKSKIPADIIMDYKYFNNVETWKIYRENNFLDQIWHNLVFSFRSDRGMNNYFNSEYKKIIQPWTRKINNSYQGAFHIRIAKK